jgi:hypothetical protein
MLTILTAALLDFDALKKTAASVLPLLAEDVQWLVKLSAAATPEIRMLLSRKNVTLVETPDQGLYEGLNQGLTHVLTPFFFVLPAGDEVVTENFPVIKDLLRQGQAEINALFTALRLRRSGRVLFPEPSEMSKKMACPHPSSILRTERVRDLGGFDTRYAIAADYDLLSRFVRQHSVCHLTKVVLVDYEGGGMSDKRFFEGLLEEELIRVRIWKIDFVQSAKSVNSFCLKILSHL